MVVHANVMSGLVGLIPAVLTLNMIPGPAISTYGWSAVTGLVLSVIGTFVHWWFSSAVEFGAIRKHERWRKEKLTFENFKEANKRSYRLILLYFILIHAIPLLRDHG